MGRKFQREDEAEMLPVNKEVSHVSHLNKKCMFKKKGPCVAILFTGKHDSTKQMAFCEVPSDRTWICRLSQPFGEGGWGHGVFQYLAERAVPQRLLSL